MLASRSQECADWLSMASAQPRSPFSNRRRPASQLALTQNERREPTQLRYLNHGQDEQQYCVIRAQQGNVAREIGTCRWLNECIRLKPNCATHAIRSDRWVVPMIHPKPTGRPEAPPQPLAPVPLGSMPAASASRPLDSRRCAGRRFPHRKRGSGNGERTDSQRMHALAVTHSLGQRS